jgi:hypothetical protein
VSAGTVSKFVVAGLVDGSVNVNNLETGFLMAHLNHSFVSRSRLALGLV